VFDAVFVKNILRNSRTTRHAQTEAM